MPNLMDFFASGLIPGVPGGAGAPIDENPATAALGDLLRMQAQRSLPRVIADDTAMRMAPRVLEADPGVTIQASPVWERTNQLPGRPLGMTTGMPAGAEFAAAPPMPPPAVPMPTATVTAPRFGQVVDDSLKELQSLVAPQGAPQGVPQIYNYFGEQPQPSFFRRGIMGAVQLPSGAGAEWSEPGAPITANSPGWSRQLDPPVSPEAARAMLAGGPRVANPLVAAMTGQPVPSFSDFWGSAERANLPNSQVARVYNDLLGNAANVQVGSQANQMQHERGMLGLAQAGRAAEMQYGPDAQNAAAFQQHMSQGALMGRAPQDLMAEWTQSGGRLPVFRGGAPFGPASAERSGTTSLLPQGALPQITTGPPLPQAQRSVADILGGLAYRRTPGSPANVQPQRTPIAEFVNQAQTALGPRFASSIGDVLAFMQQTYATPGQATGDRSFEDWWSDSYRLLGNQGTAEATRQRLVDAINARLSGSVSYGPMGRGRRTTPVVGGTENAINRLFYGERPSAITPELINRLRGSTPLP